MRADLEDKEEGDSDCQIVDVSPGREQPSQVEAPRAPSTPSVPKGLWRLKKSRETSVTLQLIPDVCRDAPEKESAPYTRASSFNGKPSEKSEW